MAIFRNKGRKALGCGLVLAAVFGIVALCGMTAALVQPSAAVNPLPEEVQRLREQVAELKAAGETTVVVVTATPAPQDSPSGQTQQDSPTNVPSGQPQQSECAAPAASYQPFHPASEWDWDSLNAAPPPTRAEFLAAHGLNESDIQSFEPISVSWEAKMFVVELKPELYGKVQIPLLEGWTYTPSLTDDSVEIFWGGDPTVPTACIQWGFTARWVPSYDTRASNWLSVEDPRELAGREIRFGRYLRSPEYEEVRSDIPYFERLGPYYTGTGNLDVQGWVPPSLDEPVPASYMDACSMLGGLCRESEWSHGVRQGNGFLNWTWKYSEKVAGSADYCPAGDPCWQTTYVPSASRGYIEIWIGNGGIGPDGQAVSAGGPYKFYVMQNDILADGFHNVDEFSYHADPAR